MTIIVQVQAQDQRTINMSAKQATTIQSLVNARRGGMASVTGYKPTSNYIEGSEPTQNIQMITSFDTSKLYARKIKALNSIELGDVINSVLADPKLAALSTTKMADTFNQRKAMLVASMEKTLAGDRDDSLRAAHDLCYAMIDNVKIHLVTKKIDVEVDGKKKKKTVPVIAENGFPTIASIMVPYLCLNVTTVVEGVRTTKTKSGAPVLMGNAIKKCLNQRSVGYKTLSLKADNFTSFKVDRQEFVPEDVTMFGDIIAG